MKKRRIIISVVAIIVIIAIACGYSSINHQFPQSKVMKTKMGEEQEFQKGVTIRVDKRAILSDKAADEIFKKVGFKPDFDIKVMEVTVTLDNKSQKNETLHMSDMYLESTGASNGLSKSISDVSDGYYAGLTQELKPGESRQIILPYEILSNQFSKSQWKKIKERDFRLTYSAYPVKRELELQ